MAETSFDVTDPFGTRVQGTLNATPIPGGDAVGLFNFLNPAQVCTIETEALRNAMIGAWDDLGLPQDSTFSNRIDALIQSYRSLCRRPEQSSSLDTSIEVGANGEVTLTANVYAEVTDGNGNTKPLWLT